ncbi:hypothetical protein ACQPXM_11660 [Kribbella sp. CA-253562]|uniref:COG1470 family protein n=1 Tax=Kribbella sp. CA-253562 TaxID=3239942 RepID=UPI003D8A0B82
MTTSAYLSGSPLRLSPGGSARCQMKVSNHGSTVESYVIGVTGDLAAYSTVEPAEISLYPGSEGAVTVAIELPADAPVRAGEIPFGVVVEPQEDPSGVTVPEGLVTVEPVDALKIELVPQTSHGRFGSRHRVAVHSRGNRPITLALTAKDPNGALDFSFRPARIEIEPHTARFVTVGVRPVDRIWRGPAQTRGFTLIAAEDRRTEVATAENVAAEPLATLDGTMVQAAVLPPWIGRAAVGGLAGVMALLAVWFLAVKPTIRSTAEEALARPVTELNQKADAASDAAQQAKRDADQAKKQSADQRAGAKPSAEEKAEEDEAKRLQETQQQTLEGTPFDRRLAVDAAPASTSEATFKVPQGQVLRITDLVFESPGNVGTLQIRRDGKVLISLQPQTFRDGFDQHFVSPIIFSAGERLIIRLACTTPAPGDNRCRNAVYAGGSLAAKRSPAKPSATPAG